MRISVKIGHARLILLISALAGSTGVHGTQLLSPSNSKPPSTHTHETKVPPLTKLNQEMRQLMQHLASGRLDMTDFEQSWNQYLMLVLSQNPGHFSEDSIDIIHQTISLVDDIFLTTQSESIEAEALLFATERTRTWLESELGRLMLSSPRLSYTGANSLDGPELSTLKLEPPLHRIKITSGFGHRVHPVTGKTRFHKGTDFRAGYGTPVRSAAAGIVETARKFGSYGNYVVIRHSDGYKTSYAHLSKISVRKGERVHTGHLIGQVGSTGMSTGPHLHFGLQKDGHYLNPKNHI